MPFQGGFQNYQISGRESRRWEEWLSAAKEMGEGNYRYYGSRVSVRRDEGFPQMGGADTCTVGTCLMPQSCVLGGGGPTANASVESGYRFHRHCPHPQSSSSADRDEDATRPSAWPLPPCLRTDLRAGMGLRLPLGILGLYLSDT